LDEFVVGGRNGPKVLNVIEEALDEVALAVKCEIAIAFGLSVAFGGNYGHDFSLRKTIEERISVVALSAIKASRSAFSIDQALGPSHIVDLPCREHQIGRIAQDIDKGVNFRYQPAHDRPIAWSPSFLSAGTVSMSARNGGVDHHVFVIGVARQQLENPLKNPALRPSTETLMHAPPIAERRRQIAPRNAGSEPVENGFNEQPVTRRHASDMAFAPRQNILDLIPLVVA
jgi:hypothetical protein